jgi:hypothetical protein
MQFVQSHIAICYGLPPWAAWEGHGITKLGYPVLGATAPARAVARSIHWRLSEYGSTVLSSGLSRLSMALSTPEGEHKLYTLSCHLHACVSREQYATSIPKYTLITSVSALVGKRKDISIKVR